MSDFVLKLTRRELETLYSLLVADLETTREEYRQLLRRGVGGTLTTQVLKEAINLARLSKKVDDLLKEGNYV